MSDDANNDPIAASLGINPLVKSSVSNMIAEAHNDSAINDFESARANILEVIETSKDAIDNLLVIANSSQLPKAYEVLSKLIDSSVAANKSLLDLQTKIRELKEADIPHNEKAKSVTNNLFVGSTTELQKMLKELKNG